MALSDFTVADILTELSTDSVFASLTPAQQMQVLNTASQRVANLYNKKHLQVYLADNLAGVAGSIVSGADQCGVLLNVTAQTPTVVTFVTPFTTARLANGDYALEIHGIANANSANQTEPHVGFARSGTGLILSADFDCDYITWKASPFTQ